MSGERDRELGEDVELLAARYNLLALLSRPPELPTDEALKVRLALEAIEHVLRSRGLLR